MKNEENFEKYIPETTPLNSENQINQNLIVLSETKQWSIFSLFIINNILISLDLGSIPASTSNLYEILKSNQEIALFGSLVFLGSLLGALLSFYLFNIIHKKKLLIFSMIGISICLSTFILSKNIFFLLSNRLILGIFQAFVIIYLPLWCNQYGINNSKTIMILIGRLTMPIGIFIGYLIASLFISYDNIKGWKYCFIVQSIAIFVMSLIFIKVPNYFFDNKLFFDKNSNINDEEQQFLIKNNDEENNNSNCFLLSDEPQGFENIMKTAIKLTKHKIFLYTSFSLSIFYFTITGFLYWISDYMTHNLNIHSPKLRLLYFSIIYFSSQIIGIFFGGFIINYIGGYNDKKLYTLCIILSIFFVINGIILNFCNIVKFFILFSWFALFYVGTILPILAGIIISCLDNNLQASGNSFTLFIITFFGYFPSPYIYGAILDLMKDKGKISMIFNMGYSTIAIILMIFCTRLKFKIERKKEKQRLKDEKLKKELEKQELLMKRGSIIKSDKEIDEKGIKASKFKLFGHSSESSEESEESEESDNEDSEGSEESDNKN